MAPKPPGGVFPACLISSEQIKQIDCHQLCTFAWQVEAKIKQGPKAGLTDFVNAVRRLQECTDFLSENK